MESTPSTGEHFGRYRLERRIGHGGMGVVYEAYDPTLERTVAVKVLHANLNETDDYRSRFEREAAVLARIRSRHIVQVHDFGSQGATIFLVTEFFPDGDLHAYLRREGVLPRLAAVHVVAQICEGLADAHNVGVLHRDVKPSNVLLWKREEPIPYLCDFGIATDGKTGLTQTGAVVGSLGYMAPERHLGMPADVRGDVYSVGCLLWAVLTGAAPYTGTDFQIAHGHINEPIRQLLGDAPIDVALNAVLADAMAKDPDLRIPTAEALRQRLLAVAREFAADPAGLEPVLAPPTAAPAADHTVLRATPTGGAGGTGSTGGTGPTGSSTGGSTGPTGGHSSDSGTMFRPAATPPAGPPPAPPTANRSSRRWVPFAIAGGVVLIAAAAIGAVVAASSGGDGNRAAPPVHSSSTAATPTPTPSPSSSSTAPATSAPASPTQSATAPAGPRTITLVRSGTCASYTDPEGHVYGCSTYDIVVTGFPAGSRRVSVLSCFSTVKCNPVIVKHVPVGADGSGTLKDGIQRVYDGYVLTVRSGPTGTATRAP